MDTIMKLLPREEWENNKPLDKGDEYCPLCNEKNLIVWEGKHLRILHNKYPVLGLDNHLMVIPKRHITHTKDLNKDEMIEMIEVEAFMEDYYDGDNYFSFIRETLGGKSLAHVHYHYLPGMLYYDNLEAMLQKQGYPKNHLGKV